MPDIVTIGGNLLLFSLVFGMSATVDIRHMRAQVGNVRAILCGITCQFLLLPALGFLMVKTLRLDAPTGVTLLVVTSSPGGSYSNWWCSLFNADLALSVTMTAISTVLSICALPLNLFLYTRFSYEADIIQQLDWTAVFVALGVVIGAIGLGLLCSATVKSKRFNKLANQLGNAAGLLLIIFSATMTNTGNADSKIWSRHWSFYVAVLTPCVGGLFCATCVSSVLRLKPAERVTVAVEACYQNVGIATSLALTMFEAQDLNAAMGVPFFYGVVEAVCVGLYCIVAWKSGWTKAPANAPLWQVIVTSYEVLESENEELLGIEVDLSDSNETERIPDEYFGESGILTTYFDLAWMVDQKKHGSLRMSSEHTESSAKSAKSLVSNKSMISA